MSRQQHPLRCSTILINIYAIKYSNLLLSVEWIQISGSALTIQHIYCNKLSFFHICATIICLQSTISYRKSANYNCQWPYGCSQTMAINSRANYDKTYLQSVWRYVTGLTDLNIMCRIFICVLYACVYMNFCDCIALCAIHLARYLRFIVRS